MLVNKPHEPQTCFTSQQVDVRLKRPPREPAVMHHVCVKVFIHETLILITLLLCAEERRVTEEIVTLSLSLSARSDEFNMILNSHQVHNDYKYLRYLRYLYSSILYSEEKFCITCFSK